MKFFKLPAWLIGGMLGLLYYSITYLIDIGQCQIFADASHCSGMTGLITFMLNFPAVLIMQVLGIGSIWLIPILDFFLGAAAGFFVRKIFLKMKR